MNMRNTSLLDINKFTPYAVGFDRLFDQMNKYLDSHAQSTGYPPYNITHVDNQYTIEIALAGVSKEDIEMLVTDNILSISYKPETSDNSSESWIYRGIANRGFTRKFTLADDIEVKEASMNNGLLTVVLERLIPETKKPKVIAITSR